MDSSLPAAMITDAEGQPSGDLCLILKALASMPWIKKTDNERTTQAVIVDVLVRRHPEVDQALDDWAAQACTQTSTHIILTTVAGCLARDSRPAMDTDAAMAVIARANASRHS